MRLNCTLILLWILTCPELFYEVLLLALGQVHRQLPKLKKKIRVIMEYKTLISTVILMWFVWIKSLFPNSTINIPLIILYNFEQQETSPRKVDNEITWEFYLNDWQNYHARLASWFITAQMKKKQNVWVVNILRSIHDNHPKNEYIIFLIY